MSDKTRVAGVAMVPFTKPGRSEPYDAMAATAARAALADAGIDYGDVQQAYVGFVLGDTTSGQQALYQVGLTGIPVINVNNACATGSSALFLARQAVESGAVDVALAVGFEQMTPGALASPYADRPPVNGMLNEQMTALGAWNKEAPVAANYFGAAAVEYQRAHGTRNETFARVSVKARDHAARNPFAIFRDRLSVEEVLASPHIYGPLTRFQCCPPTCGAAAVIVVSAEYARRHGISQSVGIAGQAMTTDGPLSFQGRSMVQGVGFDMTRRAADQVYQQAGVGPGDVDVVELHDCFTANEIISYEALGLTSVGMAEQFILDGDNTYGGKVVVNPSGGLLSKGHPLGATGLAQIAELVWHLRGNAGERQVEGARVALQHNIGLGGACVVTLLRP